MSIELIESIINGDYVSANELFNEQVEILREQKLYEEKKRVAAEKERKPFVQNTKADWAKYRKQNKLPKTKFTEPEPRPFGAGGKLSAGDIKRRRAAGYLQAFPALKSMEFIKGVQKHLEGQVKKKRVDESDDYWTKKFKEMQARTEKLKKDQESQGLTQEPPRSAEAIGKTGKKAAGDKSPWLRRAELEKRRQARIASTGNPLKAAKFMTKKEIGKAVIKKVGKGILGAIDDIGSRLEE